MELIPPLLNVVSRSWDEASCLTPPPEKVATGQVVPKIVQGYFETPSAADKCRAFEEFLSGLVGPDDDEPSAVEHERRSQPRYARPIPIAATPLDAEHRAAGPALQTIARDISVEGACLICNEPVTSRRLMLELESSANSTLRLVMEVLRCRQVLEGWHEIAGQFVHW